MTYSDIFGIPYALLLLAAVAAIVLWTLGADKIPQKTWRLLNALGSIVALYLILRFTVLGRMPSDVHRFAFAVPESGDFLREMVMNAVLYFPLGLCLSTLIGKYSIPVGFLLSLSIEVWQYLAGTGVAQGTDMIMNTLGAILGSMSLICTKPNTKGFFRLPPKDEL